ncbi:MAG: GntR family transcriptional regulator [Solirubrobacterales bacterium]
MGDDAANDLTRALGAAAGTVAAQTGAQRTAHALREAILSGRVGPGAQVGESRISTAFDVSRNTAREALRLLAAEGLVSHQPNHSPIVTVLGSGDVEDVFAVRTVIEVGAIDLIARRRAAVDFGPLREAVARLGRLAEFGDPTEVIEADLSFHAALVGAAGSPRLTAAFSRIENEVRLCLSISTRSHGTVGELVEQHDQLLKLAEGGRHEQLRKLLREDMEEAARIVIDGLPADGEPVAAATPEAAPGGDR